MKTTINDFDEFYEAFLTCALWSTSDENDEPLDRNHSIADIDTDCAERLKAHAFSFWCRMYCYIDAETNSPGVTRAGHDFWLTSQGHGSGFWDGHWPKYGDMLTKLSKCYPNEMEIWFKE